MASRMRSAVESYAKAHNISNEQATQELASTSTGYLVECMLMLMLNGG
ncbi:hypothetical protein BANRA_05508 [Escherichia coli]|uniref:Uncharacterized protein n=1 Tax=Escherichia coli TaxID=562 RepID=A0A3P5HCH6_ECOLX|nr:hypothetical protein BANRA_05508 [Escherichia coli]